MAKRRYSRSHPPTSAALLRSQYRKDLEELCGRHDLRASVRDLSSECTAGPTGTIPVSLGSGPLHQVTILDVPASTNDEDDTFAELHSVLACGLLTSHCSRAAGFRIEIEVIIGILKGFGRRGRWIHQSFD